jgi:Rrf2 family protein
LSKVLQGLARAGLVVSNPGRGGGFLLARDAERIRVLDVVNAVDGVQRIKKCPLGLRSHGRVLCPLHKRLDEAMAMVEEAFAKSTIAELITTPSASTPLCNGRRAGRNGREHAQHRSRS